MYLSNDLFKKMSTTDAKIVNLKKNMDIVFYSVEHSDADFKKLNPSDVSNKITIVDRCGPEGRLEDKFQAPNEFTTKLKFFPPVGYYVEIVGTDELVKCGYFMPHPKIVEPHDSGDVKVTLIKYVDSQDIEMPFEGGLQAVIRSSNYCHCRKGGVQQETAESPKQHVRQPVPVIQVPLPKKPTMDYFS